MKKLLLSLCIMGSLFASCSDNDDIINSNVLAPDTYVFERETVSTVSFEGQTTRIDMAEELASAIKDNTKTKAQLDAMFAHVEGLNDFNNANLNASNKSI
jgi:hypothetical protein